MLLEVLILNSHLGANNIGPQLLLCLPVAVVTTPILLHNRPTHQELRGVEFQVRVSELRAIKSVDGYWAQEDDEDFGFAVNFYWNFDDEEVYLDTHSGIEFWTVDPLDQVAGYYLNLEVWTKYDQQTPAYQCCWELPAAPLADRSENAPRPSAAPRAPTRDLEAR